MATEAAWLNGNNSEKGKKRKEKNLDTHRPSHGRTYGQSIKTKNALAQKSFLGCQLQCLKTSWRN